MASWDQSDRDRVANVFDRAAKKYEDEGNKYQAEKNTKVADWYRNGCKGECPK